MHILVALASAFFIQAAAVVGAGDSEDPTIDQLVFIDDHGATYVPLVEDIAIEAGRVPDAQGRVLVHMLRRSDDEMILLRDYKYSAMLPSFASISTLSVDCLRRTIDVPEVRIVTSEWYAAPKAVAGRPLPYKPGSLADQISRFACDSDYRAALIARQGDFSRDQVFYEVMKRAEAAAATSSRAPAGSR
jgi:hypothetical protein